MGREAIVLTMRWYGKHSGTIVHSVRVARREKLSNATVLHWTDQVAGLLQSRPWRHILSHNPIFRRAQPNNLVRITIKRRQRMMADHYHLIPQFRCNIAHDFRQSRHEFRGQRRRWCGGLGQSGACHGKQNEKQRFHAPGMSVAHNESKITLKSPRNSGRNRTLWALGFCGERSRGWPQSWACWVKRVRSIAESTGTDDGGEVGESLRPL